MTNKKKKMPSSILEDENPKQKLLRIRKEIISICKREDIEMVGTIGFSTPVAMSIQKKVMVYARLIKPQKAYHMHAIVHNITPANIVHCFEHIHKILQDYM